MAAVDFSIITYLSCDGETDIFARLWEPKHKRILGVVHILHGMEEHSGRYHDFASYLAAQGFAVCANDMLGHGHSVRSSDDLGCLPMRKGRQIVVEDVHFLRTLLKEKFSDVPYILFGHSMGSFIARVYISQYGEGVHAAVLCGSGQVPLLVSTCGGALARLIAGMRGERYKSTFLARLGIGAYNSEIEKPRTEFDWLCTDPVVVDDFIADPLCGVPFSAGSYSVLAALVKDAARVSNVSRVSKEIPILFVSGAQDPVGDRGAGISKAADQLCSAGMLDVEVKLYKGMRHEILNEPDKKRVYEDVACWIFCHLTR